MADGRRIFMAAGVHGGYRTLFLLSSARAPAKSSMCCTVYTVVNVTFCMSVNGPKKRCFGARSKSVTYVVPPVTDTK